MAGLLSLSLLCLSILLVIPMLLLAVECVLGIWPLPNRVRRADATAIVLIPAHNEELIVGHTLSRLRQELGERHHVLLVADNCTDSTASIASRMGAKVIERKNLDQRGKGYALAFGVEHIAKSIPVPDVVVVLDADCEISGLDQLVQECKYQRTTLQCIYLMEVPPNGNVGQRVAAFAFRVKNLVRLRGLRRLAGTSLLTGTGMAFPWEVIQKIDWGGGELVEDLAVGLSLLQEEKDAPRFTESACVKSRFPSDQHAAYTQCRRWEHGRLHYMLSRGPKLLGHAFICRRWKTLFTVLDACVPPLSLLATSSMVGFTIAVTNAVTTGETWPVYILATGMGALTTGIFSAWLAEGMTILPPKHLLEIPRYVFGKLSLYATFVTSRETSWVRTSRS